MLEHVSVNLTILFILTVKKSKNSTRVDAEGKIAE